MVGGGQTVALDLRALRDHQVPDARGRTLPPDAASGQVNWSVHGSESQGMIGRAEQADLAHGLATSYACFNCCPDSFNNGFLRPNPIRGFPGDQTLCEAMEVDQNCYGALQDPFQVSGAAWSSSDAGVATVDGAGLATAQNVGSANIRASWETLRFIGGVGTCRQSSANFVAEALCDVLDSPVTFTRATAKTRTSSETSAQFEGFSILTANLTDPDCPGADQISVIVSFLLPRYTDRVLPTPDTRVTLDRDNKYQLVDVSQPEIYEDKSRGFIEFVVRRRSDTGGTSNKIIVRIAGRYQSGDPFTGTAYVRLICAY